MRNIPEGEGIVHVGGGTTGLASALRLANEGIPNSVIVDDGIPDPGDFGQDRNANSQYVPVVPKHALDRMELGGEDDMRGLVLVDHIKLVLGGVALPGGRWFSEKQGVNDAVAIRAKAARNILARKAAAHPLVTIVEGKVIDILLEPGTETDPRRQARGVVMDDGREIRGGWFLDATGKTSFLASKVEDQLGADAITTIESDGEPTEYLAGYVNLDNLTRKWPLRHMDKVGYLGSMASGARILMVPSRLVDQDGNQLDDTTHLVIVSGTEALIEGSKSAVPKSVSRADAFGERVGALASGPWEKVASAMGPAKGINTSGVKGQGVIITGVVGVNGLGDAHWTGDPAAGKGFEEAADDIDAAVQAAVNNDTPLEASRAYGASVREVIDERDAKTTEVAEQFVVLGKLTKGVADRVARIRRFGRAA